MAMTNGDVSLCFSGGLDSTMTAFLLAEKFSGRIHLLTMLHRHGQLLHGLSRRVVTVTANIIVNSG